MLKQWEGAWKRVCSTHTSGSEGFAQLRDAETLVVVESDSSASSSTWSFGASAQAVRQGFTISASPATGSAQPWVSLVLSGTGLGPTSSGLVSRDGRCISLQLVSKTSLASVTYRLLDDATATVVLIETPSDLSGPSTVQEGYLFRLPG